MVNPKTLAEMEQLWNDGEINDTRRWTEMYALLCLLEQQEYVFDSDVETQYIKSDNIRNALNFEEVDGNVALFGHYELFNLRITTRLEYLVSVMYEGKSENFASPSQRKEIDALSAKHTVTGIKGDSMHWGFQLDFFDDSGKPIQDVNNHIFVLDHKATKVENVIKRVIKNIKKNEAPFMEEYHDADADF